MASNRRAIHLVREMFTGVDRRATIVLLTSSICLVLWHFLGNYDAWLTRLSAIAIFADEARRLAAFALLASTVLLLGIIPLVVVKFILRDPLSEYGVRLGSLRFAAICSLLAAPLIVYIGYSSAQSPEFQTVYPINPLARNSSEALLWHLVGQCFWYASWEFHFRGFLQQGMAKSFSVPLGIGVQTLASTLAHFGRPEAEVFASILAGLLWGALAWRTQSLLAGIFQHWLLGASLDYFIGRHF
ncbi:MAG: CPBP family intramembrane metalloprotease [Pirellulales bacterium]|nr:CPBP family intramembrane metalloprotease [Pirellulales bacterium]